MVTHILNDFSPSGSQPHAPFYFFHTKLDDTISPGTPVTGASNARGMEKSRFLTNISLFLGSDAR